MKRLEASQLGRAILLVWVKRAAAGRAKSREEGQQHSDLVLLECLHMQQQTSTYTKHKHSTTLSYIHEIIVTI